MVGVDRFSTAVRTLAPLLATAALLTLAGCTQPVPVAAVPPPETTSTPIEQPASPLLPKPAPPRFSVDPRPASNADLSLLPTITPAAPAPVEQPTLTAEVYATESSQPSAEIFAAQGVFTVTRQAAGASVDTGRFALIRSPASNRRGYNEFYRLAVNSSNRDQAAIAVYLVDDWIAVNLGHDQWLLMPYRTDSPFVAAIQAVHRLPVALLPLLAQAEQPQSAEIAGQPALHYRLTQPGLLALLLPDLSAAEETPLSRESAGIWVSDPGGEVVRLELQATIASDDGEAAGTAQDASTLDLVYNIVPDTASLRSVIWPDDAPPVQVQAPGFAEGTFPIPPGSVRVYPTEGSLELIVDALEDEVVEFYKDSFSEIGWSFAGNQAVYAATHAGVELILLISRDPERSVTRVVVTPAQ